jgi:hypothetical protein
MVKQEKKEKIGISTGGMALAGVALLGNYALNIVPSVAGVSIASSIALGGILLDKFLGESKYQKLFRMCGLKNANDEVPIIIKKVKDKQNPNITTLVLHLPEGVAQHNFEDKQQELEQSLNCKIEFGFNKNLIMKLINFNLGPKYQYEFEECDSPLKFFSGYSDYGKYYLDIEECPHILIGGEPKTGKSTLLRTITASAILSKYNIIINLHDFQDVELGIFRKCKKVQHYGSSLEDLDELLDQMEEEQVKRLQMFNKSGEKYYINSISKWNKYFPEKELPPILNLIDECQTIDPKRDEEILSKIGERTRKDRKVGIHWVFGYHRPSADSIPGRIKGSIPTRIAFHTTTKVDSEVILDESGAEKLSTRGRCIIKGNGEKKEVQVLLLEEEDCLKLLKQKNAYKSIEELELENRKKKSAAEAEQRRMKALEESKKKQEEEEAEAARKQQIDNFHKTFKNPYRQGGQ